MLVHMDSNLLKSFVGSLEKWAALSDSEKAVFKLVVRNQASFDQEATTGNMDEARKELHRQNTERMQHFQKKRKDSGAKIPAWAANPDGKKAVGAASGFGGAGRPYAGRGGQMPPAMERALERALRWAQKHPKSSAAAGFGLYGGAVGAAVGHQASRAPALTKSEKKKYDRATKSLGPVKRWAGDNPVRGSALLGGVTQAAGGAAAASAALKRKDPRLGYYGGVLGSTGAIVALDKFLGNRASAKKSVMTREERNRKRREEYAKKSKAPGVPKPTTLTTVKVPKMPKAA
jgi:hypothetical protein